MSAETPRVDRGGYLHGHHASVVASHATRTAENSCGYLLPHLRPGDRLLDVGCGPGSITLDLAAHVAPGAVIGIDPAAAAISAARTAAADRDDAVTRFDVEDLFDLAAHRDDRPAYAGGFDVVHAHQVLQHLSDPVGALRAMAALAAPGRLVAARDADYASMAWYPRLPGLDTWMRLYQTLAREAGGEPDAARHLRAWAQAAGLSHVELGVSSWVYATPELTRWWGNSWAERAVSSAFAERALAGGHATAAELDEVRDAWLAFAAHPDAWFSMQHGELLARVPDDAVDGDA